ncbi:MAG TPA: glycosyltransferase family 2 protein [Anaerolineales bacterium]|nr:glycosyltransferase family 2 protein [Anaerolineales bacterium]
MHSPLVSLLLPIRNEALYIPRCLEALQKQDYPAQQLEIIVVDGQSTDGTQKIVQDAGLHFQRLYLLDNPGRIVPFAMNQAIRKAQGEIIIRIDGHCEISPDYVSRCVEYLQSGEADCVGGPIETIGETSLAQAIAIGMSSKFGVGGSAFRTINDQKMYVDTVAFPAFTRQAIEKTGLFDEELVRNQDDEYSYRLRKWGGKILLAPDIKSKYYSRSSLRSLWRQYFQYGYWKVRVLQKHPRQTSLRQFIPPAFVGSLGLSLLAGVFHPVGWWSFAAIMSLYLISNLLASVWTASQRGWKYLPLLPIVFAILHFSYGAGFMLGLLKFARRWGDKTGKVPPFTPANA